MDQAGGKTDFAGLVDAVLQQPDADQLSARYAELCRLKRGLEKQGAFADAQKLQEYELMLNACHQIKCALSYLNKPIWKVSFSTLRTLISSLSLLFEEDVQEQMGSYRLYDLFYQDFQVLSLVEEEIKKQQSEELCREDDNCFDVIRQKYTFNVSIELL